VEKAYQTFLEPFGGSLDLSYVQKKVIIRIRIPVLEEPVRRPQMVKEEEDVPVL